MTLNTDMTLAVQNHLTACRRAFWHWDDASEVGRPCSCGKCPPDPASAPYDDCDTCVARESVFAMANFLAGETHAAQPIRANGHALN